MNIKILIADDNEDFLDLVKTTINNINSDIEVNVVSNGYLALKEIKEKFYDLLITDFDMPVMNGVDLIRSLKKVRHPHLPKHVLMLSSFLEEGESEDNDLQEISYMQKEDFQNNFNTFLIDELDVISEQMSYDSIALEEDGEVDVRHISNLRMDIVGEQLATMGYPITISIHGVRIEGHKEINKIPQDQSFDCIFSLPNKQTVTIKSRISDDLNLESGQCKIEFVNLSLNDREVLTSYLSKVAS